MIKNALLHQKANRKTLNVGDFYQHTFDTSRDGNVNGTLHSNYNKYIAQFEAMGVYYGDVDHPVPGQIDHWVS